MCLPIFYVRPSPKPQLLLSRWTKPAQEHLDVNAPGELVYSVSHPSNGTIVGPTLYAFRGLAELHQTHLCISLSLYLYFLLPCFSLLAPSLLLLKSTLKTCIQCIKVLVLSFAWRESILRHKISTSR